MEQFILMDYSINWVTFWFIVIFTCLGGGLVVWTEKKISKRIFYSLFFLFFLIYEGLGISVNEYNTGLYTNYYIVFFVVLCISMISFRNLSIKTSIKSRTIENFISRYSNIIIFIFILTQCIVIIYPENKLTNLITPPLPDKSLVFSRIRDNEGNPLLSFISMFLMPFFYMALYKYRENKFILFLFIFAPIYVTYCESAYIARNTIALAILFYFSLIYYYNPNSRKRYLVYFAIIIFALIPLSATYIYMREGDYSRSISFLDAIDLLFRIECSYPYWFPTIYENTTEKVYFFEYTAYILFQPIPGFLKNIFIPEFDMNSIISTLLTGLTKVDESFFVPLSGLVAESVFIYGRKLFFIHAFMLGLVLNLFLNFLASHKQFMILLIYVIIYVAIIGPRAGVTTTMFYPFIIKSFVFVIIILKISEVHIKYSPFSRQLK